MTHLDSGPVHAVPLAVSLPALPLCMSPLKFSSNGFIQVSPILFLSMAFYCRFFSRGCFTKVASIIAPGLSRERVLTRAVHKPEVRTYKLCSALYRDSCSVTSASFQQPGSYVTIHFRDIDFIWPGILRTFRLKLLLKQCLLNRNTWLLYYSYPSMVAVCILGL